MVPILNTEVFAPNWDLAEKVDLCKSYWNPQRKMGVAMHVFEIICLESQQNADLSIFLKKEGNIIFLHRFP